MTKSLRLILVGILFVLLLIYAGVNSYFATSEVLSSSFPGWYVTGNNSVLTTQFGPNNPASALQDGDEIVALNGQAFKNTSQYSQVFNKRQPGSSYTISVNRNGQRREFTLQTIVLPRSLFVLRVLGQARVLAFIWLLMGVAIFLLRPDNKQALLLALMFGSGAVGGELSANLVLADLPAWLLIPMVTVHAVSLVSVPIILHFFLIFPERSSVLHRFPRSEYLLYLPWWLVAVPYALLRSFLWITAPARFLEIPREFPLLTQSANTLVFIYLIAALTALLITYRRANQSARRKIRVVVAGSLAGLLPFFLVKTIQSIWGEFAINNLLTAAYIAAGLMLALPPLSFAYAIARHQVIPVSLIIRRSVQYLLAKNALRLLSAGVVHRDLKPENILICDAGNGRVQVRILDFGLAKLTQAIVVDSQSPTATAPLTTPGMALGTFGYMSPEQLMGGEVDEQTDLFSIGVMVVEALTGQRPFRGATYHELLTNVLNNAYHLPADPPESARLDQVLQLCLAKDRTSRFSSVAELQAQLIPALIECPPLGTHAAAALDAPTFIFNLER